MKQKSRTYRLTGVALLSTISLVLTRFISYYIPFMGVQSMRVGFGEIPIILAGFLLGPLAGAMTGFIADTLGATLFPAGPFFPGFTLSAVLTGALPGLLLPFFQKKEGALKRSAVFWAILPTHLLTSALLNTLWITLIYMAPFTLDKFKGLFYVRAPFSLLMSLVYTVVLLPLYAGIRRSQG